MNERLQIELDKLNKLIFVRRYEAARELVEKLVKDVQGREEMLIHLRRIELAVKLQHLTDLHREYTEEFERTGKERAHVCMLLVEIHGEMIGPDEAIAHFQNILKESPESAIAYYGIGFSLEMKGNVERAIFNYEKSVNIDPSWYPSYFGLSQLSYQKGDSKLGDRYFLTFEKSAPYNVYGNFDTHRSVSSELIQQEKYDDAETAIATLSEWWVENKGHCPPEILVFENLSVSKIAQFKGDKTRAEMKRNTALNVAESILVDEKQNEGVLYFTARTLEDFGESEQALRFYKKALRIAGDNPNLIQKIGGQFLSMGEYQLALDLFREAYEFFPDNQDIRFCILVSKLKLSGVNVEEYLIGKERLKQLLQSGNDKVEVLALLHSLLAKFQEDPEVHHQTGELYLKLGNPERAGRHFRKMFELDEHSRETVLKYVSYQMHYGIPDEAIATLDKATTTTNRFAGFETEVSWLRAYYFSRKREFAKSQKFLTQVLRNDPWNVTYIVQEVINTTELAKVERELRKPDPVVLKLAQMDERDLDWKSYDQITESFAKEAANEVVYARQKLRFLYADGDELILRELVKASAVYDPHLATSDLLRLLNTNFDSAAIYWALGVLHKELWQLEIASMWFEQTLAHQNLPEDLKANCYVELADCMIWSNCNLSKAIEFAKLGVEMGKPQQEHGRAVLAHAYLKAGQVKHAELMLGQEGGVQNFEKLYLRGLLEYRNGSRKKANEIWKPLLSSKSESLRAHNMKQEILKFYFDGTPYLDLKAH